jgi:hypothetical protein
MVVGMYRELFVAVASSAAALTGLLFVALSVAPRPAPGSRLDVIREVRAAASLLAFSNALTVSLFGLVPLNSAGYPAAVMGIIGILFTGAGLRSILADRTARRRVSGQLGLILLLLATFSIELAGGVMTIRQPNQATGITLISNVLVASLLIGVARAWELVGDRDTGLITSIAVLAGRERHLGGSAVGPGAPGPVPGAAEAAGPTSPDQTSRPGGT